MKLYSLSLAAFAAISLATSSSAQQLPLCSDVLQAARKVNAYFMKANPDPATPTFVKKVRPSNIWTRGVYYEGLMALYEICPEADYYNYAYDWAEFHKWGFRNGDNNRNADDYCCAQTYIDLYNLEPEPRKLRHTKALTAMLISSPQTKDWYWVDALQMGMPVLAKMGALTGDKRYFDKMYAMYRATRDQIGGGLWSAKHGLWYRDADFVPPYAEADGHPCFWSRGNGWAMATLCRILDVIPQDEAHRKFYVDDLVAMAKGIAKCQRNDGFWNASLLCEENYGGMEATGTSLFVYGLAWGINHGILSRDEYLPMMLKAWNGLVSNCIRANGSLAYVQGTGSKPSDGQPATATSTPDFEDYGTGCFLLAASEVYKLSSPENSKK